MARANGNTPKIDVQVERWVRVAGKHRYRENGQEVIIKPGDIVKFPHPTLATPKPGDNQWRMLDGPTPEQRAAQEAEQQKGARPLKAVHKGGGRWFVYTADGVPLNKEPLTKEQAKSMVADAPEE